MTLDGFLEIAADARRHPGRHEVVDGVLVREHERVPVVVKKTPRESGESRRGTRAERSLATARALLACGVPTPEPLGTVETERETWYVARRLDGAGQVRSWFLRRDDPASWPAPPLSHTFEAVVEALGRLARSMHDGGVFFRDFTDGNILVTSEGGPKLWLVDLDRARLRPGPVATWSRLRDLARPGLNRSEDRKLLLESYFGGTPPVGWALALSLLRSRIVLWDDLKKRLRPWRRTGSSA